MSQNIDFHKPSQEIQQWMPPLQDQNMVCFVSDPCVPTNAPSNVQHHTAHHPQPSASEQHPRSCAPSYQDGHNCDLPLRLPKMMTNQKAIKWIAFLQNTGKCEMRQIWYFGKYLVSAAGGIYDKYGWLQYFGQFLVRKVTSQSMTCQSFILAPAVKITFVFKNGSDWVMRWQTDIKNSIVQLVWNL